MSDPRLIVSQPCQILAPGGGRCWFPCGHNGPHDWELPSAADVRGILTSAAAPVAAPGTGPQPSVDEVIWRIEVLRDDDGRYAAEFRSADNRNGGMGEYAASPVGALAELCATLIKIAEDEVEEKRQAAAETPHAIPPAESEKEIAILKLAIPLEDELSVRIDEALKHLAMQDGFTLNGLARLFVDCQRRMAADWSDVGRARYRTKEAEVALARLRDGLRAKTVKWLAIAAQTHREADAQCDHDSGRANYCDGKAVATKACADELAALLNAAEGRE